MWMLLDGEHITSSPNFTKWPSYCAGAIVAFTGLVYIVIAAKGFNKSTPDYREPPTTIPPWSAPYQPDWHAPTGPLDHRLPYREEKMEWPAPPGLSLGAAPSSLGSDSSKAGTSLHSPEQRTHKANPKTLARSKRKPAPPSAIPTETTFARSTRAPAPSTFAA